MNFKEERETERQSYREDVAIGAERERDSVYEKEQHRESVKERIAVKEIVCEREKNVGENVPTW